MWRPNRLPIEKRAHVAEAGGENALQQPKQPFRQEAQSDEVLPGEGDESYSCQAGGQVYARGLLVFTVSQHVVKKPWTK